MIQAFAIGRNISGTLQSKFGESLCFFVSLPLQSLVQDFDVHSDALSF